MYSGHPLRELFERYARTHPMAGPVAPLLLQTVTHAARPGWTIDLGCGDGRLLRTLASLIPAGDEARLGRLVGVEISYERARRVHHSGFAVVCANAESLPFCEGTAAVILMIEVIEHLAHPIRALKEVARVLRSDGIVVISTPNYPAKRFYDALAYLRGMRASWRDDPTHFSPMTVWRLLRLLRAYFGHVELLPSYLLGESRIAALRRLRASHRLLAHILSHKLIALCQQPMRDRLRP